MNAKEISFSEDWRCKSKIKLINIESVTSVFTHLLQFMTLNFVQKLLIHNWSGECRRHLQSALLKFKFHKKKDQDMIRVNWDSSEHFLKSISPVKVF